MTTQQTTWQEYTGSDEQIAEIGMSVYTNGFITKNASGIESNVVCSDTTHFWIIPADPLREMKVRQAMTGQPVWVRMTIHMEHYGDCRSYQVTTDPDWNIPNAEYSFTPWED